MRNAFHLPKYRFHHPKKVAMRHYKPDPYNGFKNDAERRRALNTRAVCIAIVSLSFVLSPALPIPKC